MAALHLYAVDDNLSQQQGVYYARYMDDFILFARTRWHLRLAMRRLNAYFAEYGFRQHPDKTFIGSIAREFDWMGSWFTDKGRQSVAPRAMANHREKLSRLYEQMRYKTFAERALRVAVYLRRWRSWAQSDVNVPSRALDVLHGESHCATDVAFLCALSTRFR